MSVISFCKPLGATPLEALVQLRSERPELAHEPMTYAGRLDPMAEGLLVVLTGEDRYCAKEFQKLDKTYRVTFLLGFFSDTGDALGMVTHSDQRIPAFQEEEVRDILLGDHDVSLPLYSSYKVQGKPLHAWARSGGLSGQDVPQRTMRVDAVRSCAVTRMPADVFLDSLVRTIGSVTGDFRQSDILARWHEVLRGVEVVSLLSCELDVQSGTYIRSLAGVLGDRLGSGALVYRLLRTRVGDLRISL